jgi:dephospho-CoA kinase
MFILGLTGSIGMGKSAAAARFRQNGVPVFDADQAVHDLYAGGAVKPIEAAFPGTTADGGVDRDKLSKALIAEPEKFARLEAIVHPLVRALEADFMQDHASQNVPLVVLEIPLLYETGFEKLIDAVAVVSAPAAIQAERVLARPGMTPQKLEQLIARQMPDEEKRRRADFVVDTGGTITHTESQVDKLIELLRARPGRAFERHWQ